MFSEPYLEHVHPIPSVGDPLDPGYAPGMRIGRKGTVISSPARPLLLTSQVHLAQEAPRCEVHWHPAHLPTLPVLTPQGCICQGGGSHLFLTYTELAYSLLGAGLGRICMVPVFSAELGESTIL